MAADQFMSLIQSKMLTLGYPRVNIQMSPARREWNDVPLVIICPAGKPEIKYMKFKTNPNVHATYSVIYVDSNNLVNTAPAAANQFELDVIESFMNGTNALYSVGGAWNVRAEVEYDVDRSYFPEGYLVVSTRVVVDWIIG